MESFLAACVDAILIPVHLVGLVRQILVTKLLILNEFAALRSQYRVKNVQALLISGHTDLISLRLELAAGGRSIDSHVKTEADHLFLFDILEGHVLYLFQFSSVNA